MLQANTFTFAASQLSSGMSVKLSNARASSHWPELHVVYPPGQFLGRRNGLLYSNPRLHQLFRELEGVWQVSLSGKEFVREKLDEEFC